MKEKVSKLTTKAPHYLTILHILNDRISIEQNNLIKSITRKKSFDKNLQIYLNFFVNHTILYSTGPKFPENNGIEISW